MITSLLARCVAFIALSCAAALPARAMEIEGFPIEESITEAGVKLVLNGIAVRKRGYFRTELAMLYLPEKTKSVDAVYKTSGVRVLRRIVLREVPIATASRYFINDFKQVATEAEFKQLITDLGELGGVYGTISKVSRGDTIDTVWIPGKGMTGRFNGKSLVDKYNKNELFYQVYMRMYVGPTVHDDFRNGLLGASL